jgi:hypothetical protein
MPDGRGLAAGQVGDRDEGVSQALAGDRVGHDTFHSGVHLRRPGKPC